MKDFDPKTITRIKNISNKEYGKAYLDLVDKEFVLHYPNKKVNSILDAQTNEIVILYQKMKDGKRYLTHLVKPIDYKIIEEGIRENYKFGRIFQVIAYTGENGKIPFKDTLLSNLDFRNKGWGDAVELAKISKTNQIESIQNEIYTMFKPFFT
ncbi:hypothetical protein EG347_11040 [Chryseobacterium sp. G0186]|uniref:hypothetical protein n=1 Tax=Chryseobacterium sp. G0186 TaxID=2487064 RepID=UPI000F501A1A|nr:hypothetical protein [Chryseobacterium sp. G0186]AZA78015.1 hypothetical protein EG347_11040 [Chryseobacterium sp. G0186]